MIRGGSSIRLVVLGSALAAAILSASCTDPVLDTIVDDQGNETENIDQGELHRAGQRCTACHQEGGEASSSPFTLAGTVFAQPNRQVGVSGAEVRLTDSDGTKHTAKTNCVGNFFIKASEWEPKFPILVEIAKGGVRRSMRSPIGRDTSCAGCHTLAIPPADPFSQVGHIYLFATDEPGSPEGAADCKVDPLRPGSPP
jgi:mono/diheme cytochrome c family protein